MGISAVADAYWCAISIFSLMRRLSLIDVAASHWAVAAMCAIFIYALRWCLWADDDTSWCMPLMMSYAECDSQTLMSRHYFDDDDTSQPADDWLMCRWWYAIIVRNIFTMPIILRQRLLRCRWLMRCKDDYADFARLMPMLMLMMLM